MEMGNGSLDARLSSLQRRQQELSSRIESEEKKIVAFETQDAKKTTKETLVERKKETSERLKEGSAPLFEKKPELASLRKKLEKDQRELHDLEKWVKNLQERINLKKEEEEARKIEERAEKFKETSETQTLSHKNKMLYATRETPPQQALRRISDQSRITLLTETAQKPAKEPDIKPFGSTVKLESKETEPKKPSLKTYTEKTALERLQRLYHEKVKAEREKSAETPEAKQTEETLAMEAEKPSQTGREIGKTTVARAKIDELYSRTFCHRGEKPVCAGDEKVSFLPDAKVETIRETEKPLTGTAGKMKKETSEDSGTAKGFSSDEKYEELLQITSKADPIKLSRSAETQAATVAAEELKPDKKEKPEEKIPLKGTLPQSKGEAKTAPLPAKTESTDARTGKDEEVGSIRKTEKPLTGAAGKTEKEGAVYRDKISTAEGENIWNFLNLTEKNPVKMSLPGTIAAAESKEADKTRTQQGKTEVKSSERGKFQGETAAEPVLKTGSRVPGALPSGKEEKIQAAEKTAPVLIGAAGKTEEGTVYRDKIPTEAKGENIWDFLVLTEKNPLPAMKAPEKTGSATAGAKAGTGKPAAKTSGEPVEKFRYKTSEGTSTGEISWDDLLGQPIEMPKSENKTATGAATGAVKGAVTGAVSAAKTTVTSDEPKKPSAKTSADTGTKYYYKTSAEPSEKEVSWDDLLGQPIEMPQSENKTATGAATSAVKGAVTGTVAAKTTATTDEPKKPSTAKTSTDTYYKASTKSSGSGEEVSWDDLLGERIEMSSPQKDKSTVSPPITSRQTSEVPSTRTPNRQTEDASSEWRYKETTSTSTSQSKPVSKTYSIPPSMSVTNWAEEEVKNGNMSSSQQGIIEEAIQTNKISEDTVREIINEGTPIEELNEPENIATMEAVDAGIPYKEVECLVEEEGIPPEIIREELNNPQVSSASELPKILREKMDYLTGELGIPKENIIALMVEDKLTLTDQVRKIEELKTFLPLRVIKEEIQKGKSLDEIKVLAQKAGKICINKGDFSVLLEKGIPLSVLAETNLTALELEKLAGLLQNAGWGSSTIKAELEKGVSLRELTGTLTSVEETSRKTSFSKKTIQEELDNGFSLKEINERLIIIYNQSKDIYLWLFQSGKISKDDYVRLSQSGLISEDLYRRLSQSGLLQEYMESKKIK